jgi:hypothetical protein
LNTGAPERPKVHRRAPDLIESAARSGRYR